MRQFFLHARRAIIFEAMTYALIWTSIYQNVRNGSTSKCGRVVTGSHFHKEKEDRFPRGVRFCVRIAGLNLTRSKLAACDFYDRDRNIVQKKLAKHSNSYVHVVGYFFCFPPGTLYLHSC